MNTQPAQETTSEYAVKRVIAFHDKVMLSKRAVAVLLGISPAALLRWMDGATHPYQWTAEQALRRIEWFDDADVANGLYARLETLTPKGRMSELQKVIDDKTQTA